MSDHELEYRQMNEGPHRKRATNLRPPVLSWHRAYWIPATKSAPSNRATVKDGIDEFLIDICQTISRNENVDDISVSPGADSAYVLFNRFVSESFTPRRPEETTTRQTEVRDMDHRVVSIKFRWHGIGVTLRTELHTEYFSFTWFAEINSQDEPSVIGLRQTADRLFVAVRTRADQAEFDDLADYFYEDFWQQLTQHVMPKQAAQRLEQDILFSIIFADFRGFVVCSDCKREDRKLSFASDDPVWGEKAETHLRCLITSVDINEYSASYVLDDQAVYMSALGPQRKKVKSGRRVPITYLVVVRDPAPGVSRSPINKWQLGRFINRMHLLGTVRLAALKNLSELRDAGTNLAQLEPALKDARDSVTRDRESQDGDDAISKIVAAHSHFNTIGETFIEKTGYNTGLPYRVERSRFYVQQFERNIAALRLRRIRGVQRYDRFVQRRFGDAFDFIDRLGRRYERAINSLSMLDQNYLAIRANKTGNLANKTGDDVREIQRYGELVLFGVLAPYYIIGLVTHFLNEPHGTLVKLLTIGLTTGAVALAALRFGRSKTEKRRFTALALLVAVVFWSGLFVLEKTFAQSHNQKPRAVAVPVTPAPSHK